MNLKIFIAGIRPKTLVAGIIPPLLAYTLYFAKLSQHDYIMLFATLGLAVSIQIATNFYNDAVDYLKGADIDRVGPARITTQKDVNYKHVFYLGHLFILFTVLFSIPILIKGGYLFAILGLISIFFAYGYTGGPFPLAYLGLGELFVFLFFGLLATVGSFYLFSGFIDYIIIIQASIVGLLSCSLIAINNFRDKETDIIVNKNTMATKMTDEQNLIFLDFLIFSPYLLALFLFIFVKLEYIFVLLAAGIAHKLHALLHNYQDKAELNIALAMAGKHLFVFGILLGIANLWN